jgi:peptide/nickel transport system permease protein
LALAQRDLIVLRNVVMLLAALVILANFIVDLLYLLLDPRLRAKA